MTTIIPIHTLSKNDQSPFTARKLKPFQGAKEIEEAHRHNYYEILLFTEGKGTHMIDFETHALQATSLHFISPGQVHALNREKGVEGYVVNFTKEFIMLNGGNITALNDFPAFNKLVFPILKTSAEDFEDIVNVVKQMQNEKNSHSTLREALFAAYINILLIKCKELLINTPDYKKKDESTQQLMQRFNMLLEENFITEHKVTDYAEKLNLSPNHLSATIKNITGKTAGDLIQQRRILEAKRLLLHSSISIKELAYTLNFNDPPYFNRFFKKNTNYSPENFRNEIRARYQH